jgi:hypothetical protein
MPRTLDQIAVDVADLLKVGDDDKAANDKIIAGIVQQLEAVRRAHHFGGDVVKSNQLRADIAAHREGLQQLKDKWRHTAAVEIVADQADYILATLAEVSGPDPHYRWFDDVCAIMAHSMIKQRWPDARRGPGWQLRTLAGFLYEAATGIPNRELETACRRAARL